MVCKYKNFLLKWTVCLFLIYENLSYPRVFQYQTALDRQGDSIWLKPLHFTNLMQDEAKTSCAYWNLKKKKKGGVNLKKKYEVTFR